MSGSKNSSVDGDAAVTATLEPIECFLCAEPCRAVCVFACGHFTCYACGLRIHKFTTAGCPVCRVRDSAPVVTRTPSIAADAYSDAEVHAMRARAEWDDELRCYVDGRALAYEMGKLYANVCPRPPCWFHGDQEPFFERRDLLDHLRVNHHVRYCAICLQHRPAFLCEQMLYTKDALRHHLDGRCTHDTPSFTGHPRCRFCRDTTCCYFYDSDALLDHMRRVHYTCDICNREQFLFTFYDNRNTLLAHFAQRHKLCDHHDCAHIDPMARVFADDLALAVHRQREHGIRQHTLFTPGATTMTSGVGGSNSSNNNNNSHHHQYRASAGDSSSSNSAAAAAPATASNVNVTAITFDFVDRVERVELLPSRKPPPPRGGGGRGGAQQQQQQQQTTAQDGVSLASSAAQHGLPAHYYRAAAFDIMQRPAIDNSSSSTSSGRAAQTDAGRPRQGATTTTTTTTRSNSDDDNDEGDAHAFGVLSYKSDRDGGDERGGNAGDGRRGVPLHEAQQRLRAFVQRTLTDANDVAEFVQCTRNYMQSTCNTTEYYDSLVRLFRRAHHDDASNSSSVANDNNSSGSTTRSGKAGHGRSLARQEQQEREQAQQERRTRAVLREVVQLVVDVLPSAEKRVALQDLWKIKMAPETRHMERMRAAQAHEQAARHEAAAAAAAADSGGGRSGRSSASASPTSRSSGGNTWQQRQQQQQQRAQRSNNAWFTRDSATVVAANATSSHLIDDDNNNNASSGGGGGGNRSSSSSGSHGGGASIAHPPIATTTTPTTTTSRAPASTASATSGGSLLDELYPTLPQRGVRKSGGNARQQQQQQRKSQASRTTVWRVR